MDSSETKPKMDPYAYVANANLVLKQNRRDVPRRDKDGIIEEVETLHGKIDVAQMGQRVFREKPVVLQSTERASGVLSKPKHAPKGQKYDIHTLLKGNQFSGLTYIPKSSSSFAIYEMLLNFVSNHFLMDMPEEALRSAVDDIIIILKDAEKRDIDKKAAIELAIDVKEISQDEFAQLSGLSNKIMDFSAEDSDSTEAHEDKKDTLQKFRELDEGITIALDDEYEEDAQGENAFHVQDEEEPDSDTEMKEENQPTIVDMKEHFQTNYLVASTLPLRDKYWVDVRDIDAFWIQRQLSQYYEASHQSLDYSKKISLKMQMS